MLSQNLRKVLSTVQHTVITGALGQHTEGGIADLPTPTYGPKPSFDNNGDRHRMRASHRSGLRFQAAVERSCSNAEQLVNHAPNFTPSIVKCGPWIYYKDAFGRNRFSQPDVLLINEEQRQLIILECKLNHSRYAWGQYKHYQGLLRLMYPEYNICGVEVCKAIDPTESYAVQVEELKPHSHDFACYLWLRD